MRIIRAADCKIMPWKNGGTATEIAVSPEGSLPEPVRLAHLDGMWAQTGRSRPSPGSIGRCRC